jgi:carboxyl-terminal processing protease
MSYADAFTAFVNQLREEYAFTQFKGIDWDALEEEFLPRFQQADEDKDVLEYLRAVRDFAFRIPDRHIGTNATSALSDDFTAQFGGGVGVAIRPLDDGRVIVNYLTADSPAAQAGIQLRAEIKQWNGQPIAQAMAEQQPWVSLSTPETLAYQQARYVTRSPIGSDVTITYRNPGDTDDQTVTLTSVQENESFRASSTTAGSSATGFELPIEYRILDNGYAYVEILSFSDNDRLIIELWERLMQTLNAQQVPGLIIDMRHNGGGSGWIANQMAAYFFNQEVQLGNTSVYDKAKGDF